MRVLLNTLCTLGQKTGIGHYTEQLAAHLPAALGPGEALEGFPSGLVRLLYSTYQRFLPGSGGLRGAAAVPAGEGTPAPGLVRRLFQRAREYVKGYLGRTFRRRASRGDLAVYHEPNNIPFECDLPTVVTFHDLSVQLHPEWHPAARVAQHEQHFRRGLGRWQHIVAVSEAMRREMIEHLGVAPDRVTTTHQGYRPAMTPQPAERVRAVLRRLGLPGEYLLSVGTLEPRKNQLLLARAYVRLPQPLRSRFPLVLAGGVGWNTDELLGFLDGQGRDSGLVRAGYVADADLPALYSGARALLFPSFYEGFGLPPLEMQACGGAVVASTASAVAEVLAGSPALLLDPRDEDAWHQALLRLCSDDDFAHALRHGTREAAARYDWRTTAARTLGVYRRVANAPMRQAG